MDRRAKAGGICSRASIWGITFSILLSTTTADYARADTSSFTSLLSQLENTYFDQDYKGENDAARLDRLEKFVFGKVRFGSEGERVTKLLLASPPGRKKTIRDSSSDTSSDAATNGENIEGGETALAETTSKAPDDSPNVRIANLEQQILGKTYTGESADRRVARLEQTKFGHSSHGNVDDRLTILEAYAKSPNQPSQPEERSVRSIQPVPEMSQQEPQPSWSRSGRSPELPTSVNQEMGNIVQRVGAMEMTVFGHKNTKLPLVERIQRLEKEIGLNSQDLAQKDLPTQVESLWAQVGSSSEKSGNRQVGTRMVAGDSYASGMFNRDSDQLSENWDGTQQRGSDSHQSWLHKLAKVVGGVGGLAAGALMSPSFYPNYGYGGYSPYYPYGGMYGNSYMNPYFSPFGSGYGGYGGGYGGYYPGLGTYGWGGSPFGGGNSYIRF